MTAVPLGRVTRPVTSGVQRHASATPGLDHQLGADWARRAPRGRDQRCTPMMDQRLAVLVWRDPARPSRPAKDPAVICELLVWPTARERAFSSPPTARRNRTGDASSAWWPGGPHSSRVLSREWPWAVTVAVPPSHRAPGRVHIVGITGGLHARPQPVACRRWRPRQLCQIGRLGSLRVMSLPPNGIGASTGAGPCSTVGDGNTMGCPWCEVRLYSTESSGPGEER